MALATAVASDEEGNPLYDVIGGDLNTEAGRLGGARYAAYPGIDDWGALFENVAPESLKNNLFCQLGKTIPFSREVTARMKSAGGESLALVSSIQGVRAPRIDH